MKAVLAKTAWIGRFFRLLQLSAKNVVSASLLAFCFSLLEGLGVAMFLPILQFVQKGDAVFTGEKVSFFWQTMKWFSQWTGVPVGLPLLLVFSFSLIFLRAVIFYKKSNQAAGLEQGAISHLRKQLFSDYLDADYAYCEKMGEAGIVNALTLESMRVSQIVYCFFQWLTAVFGLAFYAIVLCLLSFPLTILAALTLALVQVFLTKRIRSARAQGQAVSTDGKQYNFFLAQKIAASKLIRIFKTEGEEKERFFDLVDKLKQSEINVKTGLAFVQAQLDPALILGAFVILYVGTVWLGVDIAAMGVFLLILLRMFPFSKMANSMFQQMIALKPSLDVLECKLAEVKSYRTKQVDAKKISTLAERIEIENVTFAYDAGETVLHDVSFVWPKNSVLALVGPSGAGKSTIVDLLLRIREPKSGQIRVDGADIKQFDLTSYRHLIGYVSQDTFLFNDTIRNNVTYGRPHINHEDVIQACRRSHCYEFINRLPLGLESQVGDRGNFLSAGERQRICLARALVRNPDILILDEPTSALDSESERLINQTLADLKQAGKTILIIAHRFSTIQMADRILVLDRGRIVESGTHEELMNRDPESAYHCLYELQSLRRQAS